MYLLNFLFYYIIILAISYLPYPVLYFISDVLYIVLYKIFGYRKKVVKKNIDNSFPKMSEAERNSIVEEFYRHLWDLIVESLKTFTISKDGQITNIKISKSSDFEKLDEAALKILVDISTIEPIPKELNKNHWEITVPIVYQIK